jgi:hypothetical protein
MNENKLPQFIIDSLKPIIDAKTRIDEIILELMPQYYIKEDKENSTDEKMDM